MLSGFVHRLMNWWHIDQELQFNETLNRSDTGKHFLFLSGDFWEKMGKIDTEVRLLINSIGLIIREIYNRLLINLFIWFRVISDLNDDLFESS